MVRPSLASMALAGACAAAAVDPAAAAAQPAGAAALFEYDRRAPLAIQEVGREEREGAVVRDLRFAAVPGGAPVRAYLVEPPGPGPFAAVLWVHWLGEPATTNRTQFLSEAVALSSRGAVSLLVDALWSEPGWYESRVPEQDYERSVRQVVALRRAVDLLAARPGVDPARIGLVGHDYGAMYGMIAAGVDARIRASVFVAAASSLSHWAFFARQPASKAAYLRQNAVLELTDYLRRAQSPVLFQFAERDAFVSRSDTAVLLAAAVGRKERRFYDADHAMAVPKAAADRLSWLSGELKLAVTDGISAAPTPTSPSPTTPR